MQKPFNSLTHRVYAILLIGLFALIYATRLFHAHADTQIPNSHDCVVKSAASCPICDYKLSNDAEDPAFLSGSSHFFPGESFPVILQIGFHFHFTKDMAARGPPADLS